ncbi:unnamed protein product, partial [Amoebophrya sp. A25]
HQIRSWPRASRASAFKRYHITRWSIVQHRRINQKVKKRETGKKYLSVRSLALREYERFAGDIWKSDETKE